MSRLRAFFADLLRTPEQMAHRIRAEVHAERSAALMQMIDEGYSPEDVARYAVIRQDTLLWKYQEIRLAWADLHDRSKGGSR